jgi:hypothetical protein
LVPSARAATSSAFLIINPRILHPESIPSNDPHPDPAPGNLLCWNVQKRQSLQLCKVYVKFNQACNLQVPSEIQVYFCQEMFLIHLKTDSSFGLARILGSQIRKMFTGGGG